MNEKKLSLYIWICVAQGLKLRSILHAALACSKIVGASSGLTARRAPHLGPVLKAP